MSESNLILQKLNNFKKKYNLDNNTMLETMELQRMKERVILKLIRQGHV